MSPIARASAISRLRTAGIAASEPRIAILMYLDGNKTHPTVDAIYQQLAETHPTLSKTTVYNTLKLFASLNLVQQLNIENGELRYDPDTTIHAHFKCRRCGCVHDAQVDALPLPVHHPHIGQLEATQIHFYGLCDQCLAAETAEQQRRPES